MHDDDEEQPTVRITFLTNEGKVIEVPAGSNLLRMSIRHQGGLPFKCGGGLCGTCFCLVEEGIENTGPLTVKEKKKLTQEEIAQGHRLGCQTTVTGDLAISWIPLDQRAKPGR
jgi:ferredoxin